VVDDDAMVQLAVEVCLQRQATTCQFVTSGGTPIDILPSPDFPEMLEPDATLRLRKPFTPHAAPTALNPCLAKPLANARLAQ
jgi:hypothetical protein